MTGSRLCDKCLLNICDQQTLLIFIKAGRWWPYKLKEGYGVRLAKMAIIRINFIAFSLKNSLWSQINWGRHSFLCNITAILTEKVNSALKLRSTNLRQYLFWSMTHFKTFLYKSGTPKTSLKVFTHYDSYWKTCLAAQQKNQVISQYSTRLWQYRFSEYWFCYGHTERRGLNLRSSQDLQNYRNKKNRYAILLQLR